MGWDKRADLAVSDQTQLRALREFLGWAVPGVRVLLISGGFGRGRPGQDDRPAGLGDRHPPDESAPDILALVASTSGMVSAVRLLPEFLRSRRTPLSITITVQGKSVVLTAANVDDVIPVLERLLDPGRS